MAGTQLYKNTPSGKRNSVIRLTRLNSQRIIVNSDLIKFIESNPDTVITLLSGDKILVHETAEEVLDRVIEFKRAVIAGLLTSSSDVGVATSSAGTARVDSSVAQHAEGRSRG
jgi:flagellar protein FlbD